MVTDGIIAEFDFLTDIVLCENSTPPILPTTSDNGITGIWNPTTINTTSSENYTFTADLGQCSTSTSLPVYILPADAFTTHNDTFTIYPGILTTESVLANDTFNNNVVSSLPSIVDYTITLETPSSIFTNGDIVLNPNGTFTIHPDIQPGTYTCNYSISTKCEVSNISSVTIIIYESNAYHPGKLEFFFCFDSGPVYNSAICSSYTSLFDLGTINGVSANSSNASIILQSSSTTNITPNINSDGTFTVAPNVVIPGVVNADYLFTYKICSNLTGYCSEDILCHVTVANSVEATPDVMTFYNDGSSIITSFNILENDIKWDCFDAMPLSIGDVIITQITPNNGFYSINVNTGVISYNQYAPIGVYELEYQICDAAFPDNCSISHVQIFQCDPTMPFVPGNPCYFGKMSNQTDKFDINLIITPNPSNGVFELIFENEAPEDLTYEVYDILGKKLFEDYLKKGVKSSFVNLENYPQGMYLLRVKMGDVMINKKLIKN